MKARYYDIDGDKVEVIDSVCTAPYLMIDIACAEGIAVIDNAASLRQIAEQCLRVAEALEAKQ